jgi:hypothetical protein
MWMDRREERGAGRVAWRAVAGVGCCAPTAESETATQPGMRPSVAAQGCDLHGWAMRRRPWQNDDAPMAASAVGFMAAALFPPPGVLSLISPDKLLAALPLSNPWWARALPTAATTWQRCDGC